MSVFVYDDSEPNNKQAFDRLPVFFQEFITSKHAQLRNRIVHCCRLQNCNFKFTSGFRSPTVNEKVGGVKDSLHLHGLAIDFVSKGFDCKKASAVFADTEFFDEQTHIHCQFKRGV